MSVIQKAARMAGESSKKQKRQYFQELKEEVKKVSWTTRDELVTCTKIVIGATFCFGIGIYFIDLMIKGAVDGIHLLVKLIVG